MGEIRVDMEQERKKLEKLIAQYPEAKQAYDQFEANVRKRERQLKERQEKAENKSTTLDDKTLNLKNGDHIECEMKDGGIFLKKEKTTVQMFEDFYGKPYEEITEEDLGPGGELDW